MLGKKELKQKAKAFDILLAELRDTEVRVLLNGMPLLVIDLEHALMLLRYNNGELEICKTHGQATVDARMIQKNGTIQQNNRQNDKESTAGASQ